MRREREALEQIRIENDLSVSGEVDYVVNKTKHHAQLENGRITQCDPRDAEATMHILSHLNEMGRPYNETYSTLNEQIRINARPLQTPTTVREHAKRIKEKILNQTAIHSDGSFSYTGTFQDYDGNNFHYEVIRGTPVIVQAGDNSRPPEQRELVAILDDLRRQRIAQQLSRRESSRLLAIRNGRIVLEDAAPLRRRLTESLEETIDQHQRETAENVRNALRAEYREVYALNPEAMQQIEAEQINKVQKKIKKREQVVKTYEFFGRNLGKGVRFLRKRRAKALEAEHNLISKMRTEEETGKSEDAIKAELAGEHREELIDIIWVMAHDPKLRKKRAKKLALDYHLEDIIKEGRKKEKSEEAIDRLLDKPLKKEEHLSKEEKKEAKKAARDYADSWRHWAWNGLKTAPKRALKAAGIALGVVGAAGVALAAALAAIAAALGTGAYGAYRLGGLGLRIGKAEVQGLAHNVPHAWHALKERHGVEFLKGALGTVKGLFTAVRDGWKAKKISEVHFSGGHSEHGAAHAAPHAEHPAGSHHAVSFVNERRFAKAVGEWYKSTNRDEKLAELINAFVDMLGFEGRVPAIWRAPLAYTGDAFVWLKKRMLPSKKPEAEVEAMTIDYDKFGDLISEKVKDDKTRIAFLKGFNKESFKEKFKKIMEPTRVADLAKGDDGRAELKALLIALFDLEKTSKLDAKGVDEEMAEIIGPNGKLGDAKDYKKPPLNTVAAKFTELKESLDAVKKALKEPNPAGSKTTNVDKIYAPAPTLYDDFYGTFSRDHLAAIAKFERMKFVAAFPHLVAGRIEALTGSAKKAFQEEIKKFFGKELKTKREIAAYLEALQGEIEYLARQQNPHQQKAEALVNAIDVMAKNLNQDVLDEIYS